MEALVIFDVFFESFLWFVQSPFLELVTLGVFVGIISLFLYFTRGF